MKSLLIVFHSMTGATRQAAEAACRGAARGGVDARLLSADRAGADDLIKAQGYLFATPENLATMAGRMKDFFDRTYYPVLGALEGRPYAALVCAGSDGTGAVRQLERIATGWRLRAAAAPVIVCTHAQTPEAILAPKLLPPHELARCEELGEALGAGMEMGIF